jgi:transketolase
MMEGISSEASSLAGHLGLGRLVVFYDDNGITIDGSTDITFTEDVAKRYEAYGWHVQSADGYDVPAILAATEAAKAQTDKPSLVILRTVIGKGSPNKEGSHSVHGAPLGEEEIGLTRKNLGIGPDEAFYVHPDSAAHFEQRRKELTKAHDSWNAVFQAWRSANPDLAARWERSRAPGADQFANVTLPEFPLGEKVATRKASGKVLNAVADGMASLVGGSADLAGSNITSMPQHGVFGTENPAGRTINFGVREHAMGAVCNGLALYGGFRPFCATFLVFSDYLRPSVRLSALMGLPVTYVFTHDSIYVGEDGPTHQPVEHNAALRTIPGVDVLRPADAQETALAWQMAAERDDGPSALILTRQNLLTFEKADGNWQETARRGAYIARDSEGEPEVVIAATGSEVTLALEVAERSNRRVRVVSVISADRLRKQDAAFVEKLLPASARIVTAEVGVGFGWEGIASGRENVFSLDRFGASGPAAEVAAELGFTAEALLAIVDA